MKSGTYAGNAVACAAANATPMPKDFDSGDVANSVWM